MDMASIAKLKGWGRGGFGVTEALVASWFETRGGAALLTMRVSDLILRRRESAVSKDAGHDSFHVIASAAKQSIARHSATWIASLRSQ